MSLCIWVQAIGVRGVRNNRLLCEIKTGRHSDVLTFTAGKGRNEAKVTESQKNNVLHVFARRSGVWY